MSNQVKFKTQISYKLSHWQGRISPICMLCGHGPEWGTHLHHILNRAHISNKKLIDWLPLSFHSLICPVCNLNQGWIGADSPTARHILMGYNMDIYGVNEVERNIQWFNDENTQPILDEVMNLEGMHKEYAKYSSRPKGTSPTDYILRRRFQTDY